MSETHDDQAQLALGTGSERSLVFRSRHVLVTHSRSVHWAAKFLPSDRRDDAAVVYAFCRLVDDIADESDDADTARRQLDRLRDELAGPAPPRPLIAGYRDVCRRRGIDTDYAGELIRGVESDLGAVVVETDAELLQYCYRVAGTVGLMMSPLLGVDDPGARPHAIDLGVGMQLTNICRDVLEDAENGRVYLPAERLEDAGTSPTALLGGDPDRQAVSSVVSGLLDLAERYYQSGHEGMDFIPRRSRLAIMVASRVYRAIGLKLRQKGCDPLQGRTVVGGLGKLRWISTALADFLNPFDRSNPAAVEHDGELHRPLGELPGTNPPLRELDAA